MADVLIIEDEDVLARSIVSFLERRGFSAAFSTMPKRRAESRCFCLP